MSSLEIAELIGKQHAHVMRDIRALLEQGVSESNFGLSSYKQQQPNGGYKDVPCFKLTKKGSLILASGYNAVLREKIIDRWEAVETGQAVPMYQISTTIQPKPLPLKDQLTWVKEVSKMLKLNDASTLGMLQQIAQPLNLPIPDYTPSKGFVLCADKLLKKNEVQLSSRKFNEIMVNHGYITYREKTSRKKGIDRFPVLTDEGLKWGENQVSPKDQRKTQIQYYEDKFPQLLEELGLLPKGE